MKYKHIVFDIDGTLIDTEYVVLDLERAGPGPVFPCCTFDPIPL